MRNAVEVRSGKRREVEQKTDAVFWEQACFFVNDCGKVFCLKGFLLLISLKLVKLFGFVARS